VEPSDTPTSVGEPELIENISPPELVVVESEKSPRDEWEFLKHAELVRMIAPEAWYNIPVCLVKAFNIMIKHSLA
jgi:hypothetical protein